MLEDIPEMYRHCKETEDKDMTPLNFLTDHLVNIDGLFDKHNNGDEQKPHDPRKTEHRGQPTVYFVAYFTFSNIQIQSVQLNIVIPYDNFLPLDYISKIFRPPIA